MNNLEKIEMKVADDFGLEWSRFNQEKLTDLDRLTMFMSYFDIFPLNLLDEKSSVGLDVGCGSGRWAYLVAKLVKKITLLDYSKASLDVAKYNLKGFDNVDYIHASVTNMSFDDNSFDFAYSLGVLHHVPDTQKALIEINRVLKPGSPFLIYLYYSFDNKPQWYKLLWELTDFMRKYISMLPFKWKVRVCDLIAFFIYFPISRLGSALSKIWKLPSSWPLRYYADKEFYVMRTDSLDRFGTSLEKRYSKTEIEQLLIDAGFSKVKFSSHEPYWCALSFKR